jgi:hypothetical protein
MTYVEEYALDNGDSGIRARADIPAGTIIGVYDGTLVPFAIKEGRLVDTGEHKYIVQIAVAGDTLYGLVSHPDTPFYGIDYINHSCDANVIARDRTVLVTDRPVPSGERLTIDYRRWDLVAEGIACWCSPSRCVI